MKTTAKILEEAEQKHFEMRDIEDEAIDKTSNPDDVDFGERHFDLIIELAYLMRDYLSAKYFEDRAKTKVYFEVPGGKDFYSKKIGTVEIDPDIAEAVQILNVKGYRTVASCSGHSKSGKVSSGYIWMEDYPKEKLPKGIYKCLIKDSEGSIRWKPKTKSDLAKMHIALLKYAKAVASKESA